MNIVKLFPVGLASLLCFALPACGGGSGGTSSGTQGLVEACSGTYVCTYDSESATGSMQRQNGVCYLGQLRMDPGGKAVGVDGTYTWNGNSTQFSVCASDGCFQCKRQSSGGSSSGGSSSGTSSQEKSCHGTPDSCPLYPPCANIMGCDLQIGYDAFGNPDDSCSGSPDPCDTIGGQELCEEQGCTWD